MAELPGSKVPRECARVSVIDSGCGIAAEHLPHVFEPFFTTRDIGEGAGLGLAAVQGIVTGHGGRIEVESRVASGTRVSWWMPVMGDDGEVDPGMTDSGFVSLA